MKQSSSWYCDAGITGNACWEKTSQELLTPHQYEVSLVCSFMAFPNITSQICSNNLLTSNSLNICIVTPPASPPSDQAFLQAADIFQWLREEKPITLQLLHYGKKTDAPLPESGDKTTQRRAYQLAFNTLKCTVALFVKEYKSIGIN